MTATWCVVVGSRYMYPGNWILLIADLRDKLVLTNLVVLVKT